jgi:hypothetical protein
MKRTLIVSFALLGVLLAAGCKTSGMAVTSQGQFLKINILHPNDLPEQGVEYILLDVELPTQLAVLDQTHGRGITVMHDPGSNIYHFSRQ